MAPNKVVHRALLGLALCVKDRKTSKMKDLYEFETNTIWIKEYPIHYAGTRFNSRMTIIRLSNGNLFIHSPCEIDEHTKIAI